MIIEEEQSRKPRLRFNTSFNGQNNGLLTIGNSDKFVLSQQVLEKCTKNAWISQDLKYPCAMLYYFGSLAIESGHCAHDSGLAQVSAPYKPFR